MAKVKQQGNGSGSVYPRKNEEGKVIGYLGAYHDPQGKRRTVSAKNKTDCRNKLRAAMDTPTRGSSTTRGPPPSANTWIAG